MASGTTEESKSNLTIEPTLFGERHDPQKSASVSHIGIGNLSLGKVMRSLCQGVIQNLHSYVFFGFINYIIRLKPFETFRMMPRSLLDKNGITNIVGGGSAFVRNKILQKELEEVYQLPVSITTRGDAAYGAALAASRFGSSSS